MTSFSEIESLRNYINQQKQAGKTIGFVPTMGALHEGHISLIKLASKHADEVVVSIYVNPRQFGPDEDFEEYPRSLDQDVAKCEALGVSAVFAPGDALVYGDETFLSIQIEQLNRYMDGGSRPGFFEGILLVVNKFFNIIEPDIAVFGQKDMQQFRILQHMVREFNHNVALVMGPIIRAEDGLALSSRNKYLSAHQRKIAPGLYRCLRYINHQIKGGVRDPAMLLDHQRAELDAKGMEIDYLGVYSFAKIAPVKTVEAGQKYILAGAVYVGETRLIDNMIIKL